jgi:predicted phosphodiesterase
MLHLSDIHYENDLSQDFKNNIVNPLIKELDKLNSEKNIDLVCISGDLLNKGKAGYNSIDDGFKYFDINFIQPIMKILDIDNSRIFFVPGNHDIDYPLDAEFANKGLEVTLVNEKEITKYTESCLSGQYDGIKRILPFYQFANNFYCSSIHENAISLFCSTFVLHVNGISIGITAINSVWRYYGSDNNLLIGKNQIVNSLSEIKECDIKIFMSHYYKESLCDFEQQIIDDIVTENYDIALLGHHHHLEHIVNSRYNGSLFKTVGKGNWTKNIDIKDIEYINGFSIVDYNITRNQISLLPKIYSLKRNEYVSDTIIAGDLGVIIYTLNKNESNIGKLHYISNFIKDSFLGDINQDLITYGTDTKAPCALNDIFVEPNLIFRTGSDPEDVEIVTLRDICNQQKNYAILGVKESGKTILLDRLTAFYLENINELRTIPVYIKYDNYTHSRFETAISNFTGVPIREIENLLTSENIVLLTDNFKFTEKDRYRIRDLIDLCKKYNKFRIIVTINTHTNETNPLEFVESSLFGICKILYLGYFKTKQITSLTKNGLKTI